MNFMLRILTIIFLFLGIVACGVYAAWRGPKNEITSWQAVNDPQKYAGREISGGYNRVVGGEGEYLAVAPFGHLVNLKVPSDFVAERGAFLSYKGKVNSQGYVDVGKIYLHKERGSKYFLSLIPLVLILIWFFREYKFDWKKFYFKKIVSQF